MLIYSERNREENGKVDKGEDDKPQQSLTELFRSILQEISTPTYLIWCHIFRPYSLKTWDKNFEPSPKSLTSALESE
uniref:Uncharacterized protein n=1 Tax=Caenorhabditis japonica TaxID=281687 RepID=A0A8R1DH21_CAEJA